MEYIFNHLPKNATEFTRQKNKKAAEDLRLDPGHCTNSEYELAKSYCIYPVDSLKLFAKDGREVWNLEKYAFLKEEAVPDSVNPSLWIYGKSGLEAGVFEIVKGAIYQVRGFDLANFTIIRSKTGWIVQDALTTAETAEASLQLLEEALNEPVKERIRAVIISHSHADHYGGLRALLEPEQAGSAEEGRIPIYVPADFDVECVRENVFAGAAMHRRSVHQFGGGLEPGSKGSVSLVSLAKGTSTFIRPTWFIEEDCTRVIDGITVEFQLTPSTEAVADMNNYYVDYRALWMADNCIDALHNLCPIRGAQIRDSVAWTNDILEAASRYADRSDVVFLGHNWPRYNTESAPDTVREFLYGNAAIYKYIHDQTLMLANQGWTAKEIAAKIEIPEGLKFNWYTRPYYGTMELDARAVFTKYLGYYNGMVTDLNPLTEKEDAALFLRYAGGEDAVIERAVEAYSRGNYIETANVVSRILLVNPENEKARYLAADAYEQLGYTAESGIWRNAYLQEALELRTPGEKASGIYKQKEDLRGCMPADLLLAYAGIRLDYDQLQDQDFSFSLTLTDGNGREDDHEPVTYDVRLYAGIFLPVRVDRAGEEAYLKLSREAFLSWIEGDTEILSGQADTNISEKLQCLQQAFAVF